MLSSSVDSLTCDMSSADYSRMIHQANESYGRRQEELKEYRTIHKNKLSEIYKAQPEVSFFE